MSGLNRRAILATLAVTTPAAFGCSWHGGRDGWGLVPAPADFDSVSAFDAPVMRGEILVVQFSDNLRGASKKYTPTAMRLELPEASGFSCSVS